VNAFEKLPRPVPRRAFLKDTPREERTISHEGEKGSPGELREFKGVLREFIGKKERGDSERRETAGASEKTMLMARATSHKAINRLNGVDGKLIFFLKFNK
jgi:hypothetical protein